MQVFQVLNVSAQGCMPEKSICSTVDVGEHLKKSRELQQSKESPSGHIVPVQPKLVPVQLARKVAVDMLYQYNLNLYRYKFLENQQ